MLTTAKFLGKYFKRSVPVNKTGGFDANIGAYIIYDTN